MSGSHYLKEQIQKLWSAVQKSASPRDALPALRTRATGQMYCSLRYFSKKTPDTTVLPLRFFCTDQGNFDPSPKPPCLTTHGSSATTHNPSSRGASEHLTHVDGAGKVLMVDVGNKSDTRRTAVAAAVVRLGPKVFSLVQSNQVKKGDVLTVAQIAGIQGAKLTSQLIPLCHNLPLSQVNVSLTLDNTRFAVVVTAECRTHGKTGVEMEALTAASVAALTVYDMCKAVSHDIVIEEVRLLSKTGGQRGDFHHEPKASGDIPK